LWSLFSCCWLSGWLAFWLDWLDWLDGLDWLVAGLTGLLLALNLFGGQLIYYMSHQFFIESVCF